MTPTPPQRPARCLAPVAPTLRLRWALAGLLLTACKPAPTPEPLAQTAGAEAKHVPPAASPLECVDAACWLATADLAQVEGLADLASARRGRAFAQAPTPAHLRLWIDGMRAAGQLRRARDALAAARSDAAARNDPALIAAIDQHLAALPSSSPSAPPTSGPLSSELREFYDLALAGSPTLAALGLHTRLQSDTRPALLADVASVIWDHAADNKDLQAWTRATWARARVLLHEQGATLQLLPVDTWMTRGVAWHADKLVLLRNVGVLGTPGLRLGLITIAAPTPGAPARRLFAPEPADAIALSADGSTLIRGEGPRVVLQRHDSGETAPPIAAGERPARLLSVGAGEALRILGVVERSAVLWDTSGKTLARFALDGTTPTITRAYTGEGTYHHNILHDDPTWPVSLASTADASTIAVGGSDSRVFVFDGAGRRKHVLKFSWDYVEHRPMGGNPDLNLPLALHLVSPGELLAIYSHGDLIRWDLRTGKPRKHLPPDCDMAEATAVVNRFADPKDPPQTPTAEQRRGCGRAQTAAFSADGHMVASGGIQGTRVRDTSSGAGLAMLVGHELPDDMLSFASDGTLAMVDLYGAVATWRRDAGLVQRIPASPSGPVDPFLSRDGQVMRSHEAARDHVWDLHTRRRLPIPRAADERVLAIADDGRRVVVRTTTSVELRDAATGARLLRAPAATGVTTYAQFTADGHALLDIQDTPRTQLLVDPQGRGKPLAVLADVNGLRLSDDASLVASSEHGKPGRVWRTSTGALVQTLPANIHHLSFARDGNAVAWLAQPDPDRAQTRVGLRRIDADPASDQNLDLDGWPNAVALSADGSELLILLQSGKLWRWRPATGSQHLVEELDLYSIRRVDFSADGRLILLAGYGHVELRRNDKPLTPLATVYALVDGGWLALSHSGAVDGSPGALASLVTRVTQQGTTQIFAGELGWDAAHVDGLVARALAGEDVQAPVPTR